MVVARPVESSSSDFKNLHSIAPVLPTKILTDPDELGRQLQQQQQQQQNGPTTIFSQIKAQLSADHNATVNIEVSSTGTCTYDLSPAASDDNGACAEETERFTVTLSKDEQHGLGITVAGYVCEREDLSGIFIKSLSEASGAHQCGKIDINDRIVAVDGEPLDGLSNHEAVEKIKSTDGAVTLTLERYLYGPKFDHLQEALTGPKEQKGSPTSSLRTLLSWIPIELPLEDTSKTVKDEDEGIIPSPADSELPEFKEIFIEENFEADLRDDLESVTKQKWENIVGVGAEIVVANLTKLKGLGISLEGTVDVEGGVELRPHHYIRSILPEGPVGLNGRLCSGDELLEVNGQKLLGLPHVDVVSILRELPGTVRLVCARKTDENRVINTSQDREAFEARNILGGSLKKLLVQPEQRLLKALSDTSLSNNNTSTTVTVDEDNLRKAISHSLETTNLAMWSENVETVDLIKGERGLGFSILDYQDPLDPRATVIVVRSLVPNGAAEQDGRIAPGDRLISVNGQNIKNVPLDQAAQALKGTCSGLVVELGISKPLPNLRQNDA